MGTSTYTIKRSAGAGPSHRIDYARELNPAQLEAATATDGPVLVVAGAGSGKTRTLVYRLAYLVENGVDPRAILLLTFTRRAAQEMLRRAEALLAGGGLAGAVGGTFHSFANTVLRRYAALYGGPATFTILDRSDAEDTLGLVRARLGLDQRERRFPRKQTLAAMVSSSINRGLRLEDVIELEYPHLGEDATEILRCRDEYAIYKAEHQLLDYDDLLVMLRDRLAESPELAERLRQTYLYLMVDEYQDTNHLQADIVALLGGERGNVMVVGDDAQSIYAFRGAEVKNILSFPERFPATRIITLEQNYRSTQPVLDLTNAIIACARERYSKTLFTRRGGGIKPLLVPAPDERLQSLFVRQRILELHEEGVALRDIAVLFRSSFHSFDLEVELARHGIPFVKRGGFRFVETAHVKDVVAHLRVAENPRDAVAWSRILMLLDGVGAKLSAALADAASAGGVPAAEALAGAIERCTVGARATTPLKRLVGLLTLLGMPGRRPATQVQEIVEYYRPILEHVHRDDHPRRARDLEQLVVLAERFETTAQALSDLALEPPSDSVGDVMAVGSGDEDDLLTLSTVHSAKGLEWHTVFVICLADGRFPSAYSQEADELEEERRLLYVACTRARENLVLTYPATVHERGLGLAVARPSRFLDEVPIELLEQVRLIEE